MTEQWLSIVEYARAYQLSDMTVRRRIKNGKLNAILKDGKYFIPTESPKGELNAGPRPEHRQAEYRMGDTHADHKIGGSSESYASNRLASQMTVVKSHPSAQRTLHAQAPAQNHMAREFSANHSHFIPKTLHEPISKNETCVADTRALLAFCEASLKKLNEMERRQVEKFKGKLEALEAQLEHKNLEIRVLRQQTEDLQLLVKTLEKMLEAKAP